MTAALIILVCFIFFMFVLFELTKPSAKKLVVLSILCSFVIFGRVIFAFFPLFTPAIGLIILFAMGTGPLEGFLIGALSALGSNFVFGQGTWTIFQMFSFGLAGLISGSLRKFWKSWNFSGTQSKISLVLRLFSLGIFGFAVVMLVTGPILDMSGFFFMGSSEISFLKVLIVGGIPFNLSTAVSTFITIFVLAKPVSYELNRINKKFELS